MQSTPVFLQFTISWLIGSFTKANLRVINSIEMKRLCLTIIIFLQVTFLFAQQQRLTQTVKGVVVDELSGYTMSNVTVKLEEVVVRAGTPKNKAINEAAVVSARPPSTKSPL